MSDVEKWEVDNNKQHIYRYAENHYRGHVETFHTQIHRGTNNCVYRDAERNLRGTKGELYREQVESVNTDRCIEVHPRSAKVEY